MRVGGIDAERVAFTGGYELGAGDAEGGVGAGVAEVPGELDAGGFDLEGGEGGSGVAGGCPEALGLDRESGEEDGKGSEREVFDAKEVCGFGAATGDEAGEEDEVSEGGEGEGDPEIEEEMVVEGGAVGAGVGGEERWGEQKRWVAGETRHAGEGHGVRISRSVWGVAMVRQKAKTEAGSSAAAASAPPSVGMTRKGGNGQGKKKRE